VSTFRCGKRKNSGRKGRPKENDIMDDIPAQTPADELDGREALKLRRLRMGLLGKQVAFDAGLAQDWFEHREAGTRRLTGDAANRWCEVLDTSVGEMVDTWPGCACLRLFCAHLVAGA
jgi:hypothetical protein